jgi:hypothetical protein
MTVGVPGTAAVGEAVSVGRRVGVGEIGAAVGAAGAQAESIKMSRIIAIGLHMVASETSN